MDRKFYGSVNIDSSNPRGKTKKGTMKDEKRPLLDNESQSDSTEPPAPQETIVDITKPLHNVVSSYKMEVEDPVLNRSLEHPTSNLDTMIHLLKGNVGTGILAMPDAFRNAGWAVGTVGTLLMGIICTHCMHMLVKCSHDLCRRTNSSALNFAEVSEYACQLGPEPLRKYSRIFKISINSFLCITQIGFCCVYFVFVAANLQEVIKHYVVDISVHWYLVFLLPPMIVLNWLKNLKYLAPVSFFASILTCTGLAITFFYMLQGLPDTSSIKASTNWSQFALFFGTAIYAFEGIGVVLPLENNMKRPQDFGGWTGVLNTGMVIVACLYTAVGFFGYLKYGDMAQLGSVTLYLPPNDILAQSVRLMMAIAIFLSYGLQFYVPFSIIWPIVKDHLETEKAQFLGEYITRTILVVITFALAAAIPNLGAVISLVGAFSSSALALIFPPLLEILTFWPDRLGKYKWIFWKDFCIAVFGFLGFILGSYVSVLNIISPEV